MIHLNILMLIVRVAAMLREAEGVGLEELVVADGHVAVVDEFIIIRPVITCTFD